MTEAQERILRALGRQSMTTVAVAMAADTTLKRARTQLDKMYVKSWVTITPAGRYCATERGRRKVGAS